VGDDWARNRNTLNPNRRGGRNEGNALDPSVLRELFANEEAVRVDPRLEDRLIRAVHPTLGFPLNGIWSIADAVDEALGGTLETATDADISSASDQLLDSNPGLQLALASGASNAGNGWNSEALMSFVLFDNAGRARSPRSHRARLTRLTKREETIAADREIGRLTN
jgi:hypothetical protein